MTNENIPKMSCWYERRLLHVFVQRHFHIVDATGHWYIGPGRQQSDVLTAAWYSPFTVLQSSNAFRLVCLQLVGRFSHSTLSIIEPKP